MIACKQNHSRTVIHILLPIEFYHPLYAHNNYIFNNKDIAGIIIALNNIYSGSHTITVYSSQCQSYIERVTSECVHRTHISFNSFT
jgi:hypothetical protein